MASNGSDGALHVTNGQTVYLSLDHKYNYTTIDIDAGGTVTTTDTVGSVLYLCAQGAINVSGQILLSGIVNRGQNTWSTTIDGILFTSPSCSDGGQGGNFTGQVAAVQNGGYGGGGHGGIFGTLFGRGGDGGSTPGTGGGEAPGISTGSSTNNTVTSVGGNGGASAGGGGAAYASVLTTGGTRQSTAASFGSGYGGNGYGNNGEDGWNPAGAFAVTPNTGSGSISFGYMSMGGGGGGGAPGQPGVNLVLRGSEVNFYASGFINTSGTSGQNGGNGGAGYTDQGLVGSRGGLGGGGGGSGNGGTITLYYGTNFIAAGTVNRNGALGGVGGVQGGTSTQTGFSGVSSTFGGYFAGRTEANYGSMITMFQ